MGVGVSIFFLTLGAVLYFAIEPDVFGSSVHMDRIGMIFMVVGGIGVVLSILLAPRRGSTSDGPLMRRENHPHDR